MEHDPCLERFAKQYELHITARASHLKAPLGFKTSRIVNYARDREVVQIYRLFTHRYDTDEDIPWHLRGQYDRFKVERKVVHKEAGDPHGTYNMEYFKDATPCVGVEIHVRGRHEDAGALHSEVNDIGHSTAFIAENHPLSVSRAAEILRQFAVDSQKAIIEVVLFDDLPELDAAWESKC